ncbi:adenylyltransferase and sulfurtransferase MOCS3 isoform X2 [Hyla sarda]|uniref:adenylyltransferase and sulfurtransferase MOCS3 isoform X2 n=1 Tax=Hyla sarda TaxID=327740 RepID=UPI0024C35EEC|nr:adenylyltransferase and sulfurtransferase MOCS3 isoform X2 [Hyla sarda]
MRTQSVSMESSDMDALREEIRIRDAEIQNLREQLAACNADNNCTSAPKLHDVDEKLVEIVKTSLTNADILRYSRQLVLPEFGVKGQLKLSGASVLIIGCGGLGCPLAQYLAAAGIGRLGLLDYDTVEISNLHRQVLHGEKRKGMSKPASVVKTLRKLNSSVEYVPYQMMLNPRNALQLVKQYDVIADCSDNVPTRYLINDACVAAGKPLVSASALRWEGQLTVYNYNGGPCYRCLFPVPPPAETVTNCADGGVLGIVPGIMGCMQALETFKLVSGMASSFSGVMLMFDGLNGQFRNIRIRGKKADCEVCGSNSKLQILEDYESFCGGSASDKCKSLHLLSSEERITVQFYKQMLDDKVPHLLIDVRPQPEVDICRLEHSFHIPLSQLEDRNLTWSSVLTERLAELNKSSNGLDNKVIVICKLGNDSQKAVKILQEVLSRVTFKVLAKDIKGGLRAWSKKIDPTFPQY